MKAFVNNSDFFRVQQKPVEVLQQSLCGLSRQRIKRSFDVRKPSLKPFNKDFQTNCFHRYNCRHESNVLDQPVVKGVSQGAFKRPWFFGGAPRRILVWFFADLRVQDNEALIKAAESGSVPGGLVLPLVSLHQNTPRSAVVELKSELQRLGSDLYILPKFSTESVLEVCHKYGIEAIYYNHAELPDQVQIQSEFITYIENRGIQVQGFWSNTLVNPEQLANAEVSDLGFSKFSQEARQVKISQPLNPPQKLPPVPEDIPRFLDSNIGTQGFSIAESTAWSLLESHQRSSYNASDGSFIFQLKPYLDHGCISARNLFDAVKEKNRKQASANGMFEILYSELLWRSYVTLVAHQRIKVKSRAIHNV